LQNIHASEDEGESFSGKYRQYWRYDAGEKMDYDTPIALISKMITDKQPANSAKYILADSNRDTGNSRVVIGQALVI
jgi:hypothetical protein